MSNIIDLDTTIPSDLWVKFGGKEWRVPGDLPVPLALRCIRLVNESFRMSAEALSFRSDDEEGEDDEPEGPDVWLDRNEENWRALLALVCDVLAIHQPEVTIDELDRHLGFRQAQRLVIELHGRVTGSVPEEEDTDPPKET